MSATAVKKKDEQAVSGPIDITDNLWGYMATNETVMELWTKDGCVGMLKLSTARRLVRLLSKASR